MPNKIDDFKEYARKRIVDKLREENTELKIEPYDNEDAVYSGSENDYRDYLNLVDVDNTNEPPLPVENTQRIGENLQNMINKVKKTAGKVAGTFQTKSEENDAENETSPEETVNENVSDISQEIDDSQFVDISENNVNTFSPEYKDVIVQLNTAITNLSDVNTRLQTIELKVNDAQRQLSSDNTVVRDLLDKTLNMTLDIKNTINSVSKLNDSIFDLKNSQQNVKMSVSDLEASFKRLKSKCITGFTIISIIGIITIALEVINLLS